MTARQSMDLLDYVRELTRPYDHREHYQLERAGTWYGQDHITRVPALLHQLQYAAPSGAGEERGSAGFESRPSASLDSIDTLVRIDLAAARWVRDLGEDDPLDTAACVTRLNALIAPLEPCRHREPGCCTWHEVEADVRRWWTWARVQTGWDSPAWRPDNTCPLCGERGALRVRLADQVASCTNCHETWDSGNIALLADHIRAESNAERPRAVQERCWCPWPRPAVDRWPGLCPVCASRWCHRALDEQLRRHADARATA